MSRDRIMKELLADLYDAVGPVPHELVDELERVVQKQEEVATTRQLAKAIEADSSLYEARYGIAKDDVPQDDVGFRLSMMTGRDVRGPSAITDLLIQYPKLYDQMVQDGRLP